jgi:hypothetical protein
MGKVSIKELIKKHKKVLEELEKMKSKEDEKETTIEEIIEKQIKKRVEESDMMFKYFGGF